MKMAYLHQVAAWRYPQGGRLMEVQLYFWIRPIHSFLLGWPLKTFNYQLTMGMQR